MIPTSEQDKMAEIIRMIGSQTNRTSIMSQQPPLLQPQPPRIPFLLSSTTTTAAPPQTTTTTTPTVANMNLHQHHHNNNNNNNNHNNNMFSVSLSPQQQQQLQQQSPQLQQPFQQQQHVQQQQQLPVHLQSYPSPISFMPQQPQPQQMTAFEKQQQQLMQQQQQLQKQYEQLQQQQLQFQQQQLQLQMQYEKISPNSCKHCRDSHRRCDRKLPSCTQCSKRSIQCHYVPSKKRKNESPAIILQHSQPSLLTTTGNNNKHRNNNTSSSSSNDDSESDSNHNRMELMMSGRPLKQARVEYNNNHHHHTVEQSSSLFSSHVSSMMSSSSSLSTTTSSSSSSSSNVHSPPLLSTIQQQQQEEVYQVLSQIPHLLASQQQPQQQQQQQPSQITTLSHDNIMNHNNSNNLSSMNNNDNNSNNHSSSSIISNNDYQRLYLATSQISDKFITMTSREPIIQLSAAVAAVANSSSHSSFHTLQQQQQQNSQSSLPSPSSSSSTASSINSPSPSYTSESSPINTSASDSNGVAMVHHQQQQQHSTPPPPLLSLSSSPAVASVSILEACFDLIEPQNAGKDFKESVIAQLLWNQMTSKSSLASSSSSSTSPLSSSTANADDCSAIANMSREEQEQRAQQVLEEKANQALWYSIQAVALLHMPSKEQEPYFDAQKRMMIYEIMSKKLGQYKATSQNDTTFFPCSFGVNTEFLLKRKRSEMEADNDENDNNDENDENGENDIEDKDNGDKDNNELANAISELPDLARLFCKFSKLQLIETARLMFNSARTLLLDVEVFPHIGTHMKLAQTSAHLVSFLLVSGERTEEAHVFLNSAKVYLDRMRDVLRLDATKLSGHARDQLETQQLAIGGLYSAYTSLKSVLYVNYAPRTSDFYRKKSLKKYLKLSIRAWKAVGNTSRRVLWSQDCQNPLRKLKAIINRNPVDATHDRRQLYDFLMVCREMRGNVEHCSGFTRIWRLFTFTIDIFALEIFASQAGTCKDKSFFDVLWELQLETAHLVIREIYSSLGLVITAGARLLMIIKFTCRIHIEHSARLCSGSTNKKELLECLAFMHTDSLTLDAIGLRTPVAALQELSEQIKLQQQYHQQYLAQLDGSSWLTNAPNSTLSNQDNGKSDISLGSISNITSCDGDEKGEEPATQFFGSIYETFQSGGDFTQEQPVAEETNFFLEFFNLEEGFQ